MNEHRKVEQARAKDSGLACCGSLLTDRKQRGNSVKGYLNLDTSNHLTAMSEIRSSQSSRSELYDNAETSRPTLIRRLRHVKQPVLVLRLISFLCRPPDIILPSGGGGNG